MVVFKGEVNGNEVGADHTVHVRGGKYCRQNRIAYAYDLSLIVESVKELEEKTVK